MEVNAYDLAQRFTGVKETGGTASTPIVLAMLQLDTTWVTNDEVAWCSAFVNFITWLLRLPRSKSLAARSWLLVGKPVPISEARLGYDVVVLKRGGPDQPGPDVIAANGHVGFFSALEGNTVLVLGGNQSNSVSIARFPVSQVLGVRRLI